MVLLNSLKNISFLSGMLNSGLLTTSQRDKYLKQFREAIALLQSSGDNYLPPWIIDELKMAGMRMFVAGKLLSLPNGKCFERSSGTCFKYYSRILFRSFNFPRYQYHIYDPSRLYVKSRIKSNFPLACFWHPGLKKLLVTTQTQILAGEINGLNPRFEVFFTLPNGNNYGIDVADDGTIVLIGYYANRIYLISPQGKLIGNHVIFHGSSSTYSGVSFSHDGAHILCFSRNGIYILRRDGTFLCTVGGKGSRPGFLRDEGQIIKLSVKNQFAISDIGNNRIQIVEIDFQTGSMKVLKIFGMNFFFKPLGIVEMGNCIVAFSHEDGCAYLWDGERNIQVLDGQFVGARFACKLPGGGIAVCIKHDSIIQIIKENYSIPSGRDCLGNKSNKSLTCVVDSGVQTSVPVTQVADSGVQTSDPPTQVADSGVQTSVPMTQVTDSGVQTNSPNESIFERISKIIKYFLGYQLF